MRMCVCVCVCVCVGAPDYENTYLFVCLWVFACVSVYQGSIVCAVSVNEPLALSLSLALSLCLSLSPLSVYLCFPSRCIRPFCGLRLTERMLIIIRCSPNAPTLEMSASVSHSPSLSFSSFSPSYLPSSSSSLSCGSVASQGTTTPQTLSTIFKRASCVRPVCVCVRVCVCVCVCVCVRL